MEAVTTVFIPPKAVGGKSVIGTAHYRPTMTAFPGLALRLIPGEELCMSVIGIVKDGVVTLPPEVRLEDGLRVEVTIPGPEAGRSFAERYAGYIGTAEDLPSDMAANLDHYVQRNRAAQ